MSTLGVRIMKVHQNANVRNFRTQQISVNPVLVVGKRAVCEFSVLDDLDCLLTSIIVDIHEKSYNILENLCSQ